MGTQLNHCRRGPTRSGVLFRHETAIFRIDTFMQQLSTEKNMNEQKTSSMLQRLPVILAVTAASYGLPIQSHARHAPGNIGNALAGASVSAPTLDRAVVRSA